MPKSFWSVVPMFGTVQTSHLRCCWLKLKAHVLPMLKLLNMAPMKNENYKTVFLNICKESKSNEMLKYSLKSIRKGPKKQWLKTCYIPVLHVYPYRGVRYTNQYRVHVPGTWVLQWYIPSCTQPYPNPTSRTGYFIYATRVLAWILVRRTTCLGTRSVQPLDNLS